MAYYICRSVLPSRLVTRQVMFLQPQKFALRKSNPVLFQPSPSRYYTNSTFPPPSPQEDSTSSFYLNKFAKATAKRLPAVIIGKLVVAGVIGLISVDLLYAGYRNRCNERLLYKTVEKGTRPNVIKENKLVPRPDIVGRLKKILQPDEDESSYYVVCGEHGTGKTTLTRIASREVGQGVIYVEVPPDAEDIEQFGIAFGESLNFAFEERISFSAQLMKKILGDTNGKVDGRPKWKRALKAFKHAGAVYKVKHNKLPVIVYDNINELVNINPKVLDTLQDDAKMYADRQEYIAVFVTSEGSVPRRMKSRSSWSRAESPMEIGDLSKEESIKYLTEKRMINETDAEKLYDLVGGRIVLLKKVAKRFKKGLKFEVIKKEILDEVEMKFKTAQLLRKQLHHKAGKKAIKALLDSKELNFTTFMEFFDNYEEADKVLEANVFSYHPEKHNVTFQSQSVEFYIREKVDIFIKENI